MKLKIDLDTESEKVIDSIQISLKYLDGTIDNVEKKVASSPVFSNPVVRVSETEPVSHTETQTATETVGTLVQPSSIIEEQKPPTGAFGATY